MIRHRRASAHNAVPAQAPLSRRPGPLRLPHRCRVLASGRRVWVRRSRSRATRSKGATRRGGQERDTGSPRKTASCRTECVPFEPVRSTTFDSVWAGARRPGPPQGRRTALVPTRGARSAPLLIRGPAVRHSGLLEWTHFDRADPGDPDAERDHVVADLRAWSTPGPFRRLVWV
jgi:hypothetical protein